MDEVIAGGPSYSDVNTYDRRNRMSTSESFPEASPGSNLQTYTYDGDGLRRSKTGSGMTTSTYSASTKLESVVTGSKVTTTILDGADYVAEVSGGSMDVVYATVDGQLMEENRGGTITEFVPDTLGSMIQTTDASVCQTPYERCVCAFTASLERGAILCESRWLYLGKGSDGSAYNLLDHDCQDYVNWLMYSCGVGSGLWYPLGWEQDLKGIPSWPPIRK